MKAAALTTCRPLREGCPWRLYEIRSTPVGRRCGRVGVDDTPGLLRNRDRHHHHARAPADYDWGALRDFDHRWLCVFEWHWIRTKKHPTQTFIAWKLARKQE